MSKLNAGIMGAVVGALAGAILVLVASEWQYESAVVEPPDAEARRFAAGVERSFTQLVWTPVAALFGGAGGGWLAAGRYAPAAGAVAP